MAPKRIPHTESARAGGYARPVAIVTGAGRGIGRATARSLCSRRLRGSYRRVARSPGAARGGRASESGQRCHFPPDRRERSSLSSAMRAVNASPLRTDDCLVNNAGMAHISTLVDLPMRDIDSTLAVNLRGPLLTTRAALPAMLRQRSGSIISVCALGKIRRRAIHGLLREQIRCRGFNGGLGRCAGGYGSPALGRMPKPGGYAYRARERDLNKRTAGRAQALGGRKRDRQPRHGAQESRQRSGSGRELIADELKNFTGVRA